jgi:phage tail-like protein
MQETYETPLMPDLVGMDLDRALRLLDLAGVYNRVTRLVQQRGRKGQVLEQSPEPGAPLDEYTTVRLAVEDDNPIRLLPEVFHDEDQKPIDSTGGERPPNMLRNFLFIIQQMLSGIERQLTHMDRQLSPEGASESFLPWLCGLVPMEFDAGWTTDRVRQVLRDAPKLLAKRGSAEGLAEMIELHAGIKVKVHENAWPQRGYVIGATRIGETAIVSTVPGPDDAFYIELISDEPISRAQLERILRLVDSEKPVHLRTMVVQPRQAKPKQGVGSAIGFDFVVGASQIAGPVVTPPARIGVPNFLAGPSGEGGESIDPAAWAYEGLSAE